MYYYLVNIIKLISNYFARLLGRSGTAMSYSFRIRVNCSPMNIIDTDKSQISLPTSNKNLSLYLSSPLGKALKESDHFTLVGSGYQTEETAYADGYSFQNSLMLALAISRLGVDFGNRVPKGGIFTNEGLKCAQKQFGATRALNDVHGLMVYKTDPEPRFASVNARATLGVNCDSFLNNLQIAIKAKPQLTERELVAFTLFNASFFQPTGDSRFILLVMAIEALVEPQERSEETYELISKFIEQTNSSGLANRERKSILGSLEFLKKESISQAGKRLVEERLGKETKYNDLSPSEFFMKCYNIRSNLVHGNMPYPDYNTVNSLAAQLEIFVSELLTQPYINN